MKDETYVFISDVKEKGSIGRSARHRKTHAGKGGRVRLPSDNLSKKELQKMSGECKSYRLNEPMAWKEFKAMPDDIKVTYINLLRGKYGVPDAEIASMLGVHKVNFSKEMSQIRSRIGDSFKKRTGEFDKEGFYAWVNGVDKLPTPVIEEIPVEEAVQTEPEAFVEDDLPFDIVPVEPDPVFPKPSELHFALCAEIDELKKRVDELLKENEALQKAHTEDKELIVWLQNKLYEIEPEKNRLEAQMEVVRMIFGGVNK